MKQTLIASLFTLLAFTQALAQTKHEKKLLQGAWFGKESDDAAVFYIDPDSVTYIEDFAKFKYTISKDTFDIITNEPHYKEIIIKLTEDSLILKELPSMEINRYWKS
jgi:hypothetical protein